jgi:hypothetical protein
VTSKTQDDAERDDQTRKDTKANPAKDLDDTELSVAQRCSLTLGKPRQSRVEYSMIHHQSKEGKDAESGHDVEP